MMYTMLAALTPWCPSFLLNWGSLESCSNEGGGDCHWTQDVHETSTLRAAEDSDVNGEKDVPRTGLPDSSVPL